MRQRQLGRAEQPPSSRERSPLVLLSSPYETVPTFMGTGEVSGAIPGRRGRPQGLGAIEEKTECSPLWGERGHLAVVFPSAHLRVPVQFRLSSLMGPRVTQRVSCHTVHTSFFCSFQEVAKLLCKHVWLLLERLDSSLRALITGGHNLCSQRLQLSLQRFLQTRFESSALPASFFLK